MKTRTFVDRVTVHVRAGRGGDGSNSFRREACVPEGGPDGGDGGRGGHVILRGDRNVDSLIAAFFTPQLWAQDGVAGSGQKMYGRKGADLRVTVPCGTEVTDTETGTRLADIVHDGQEEVVARGGKGGLGNVHFKSSTHQAPTEFTPGEPGQEFRLRLELKTLADAGLIGFPNAGKSSLLACVSSAQPKIASYPFTTLHPIVGTIEYDDFAQIRVADVPGIVAGAAHGVGLGLEFLRHIARARLLVYVIDMAGCDGRKPWDDYRMLRREVKQYDAALLERPFVTLANKMDLPEASVHLPEFVRRTRVRPLPISAQAAGDAGVATFKERLREMLRPAPRGSWRVEPAAETDGEPPVVARQGDMLTDASLRRAPFLDLARKRNRRPRR